jgi:hypothetical protein
VDETTARLSTELLRTSDEQPYRRLRELLVGQGRDPQTDVLADLFEDDTDQEFGVLVTGTPRRVLTFVMHYGRRGDLKTRLGEATLHDWQDITDQWEFSPYQRNVADAMVIVDEL